MKKKLLIGLIMLVFMSVFFLMNVLDVQAYPQYSYENSNQFLRIYDEHEAYCVNLTSGIQFGVDVGSSCSSSFFNKNELCIEIGSARRCFESLPLNSYSLISDNATYVNLTFIKDPDIFTRGTLTYFMVVNQSVLFQEFRLSNARLISAQFNFSYVLKNIQIGRTADDEILYINKTNLRLNRVNDTFINNDFDGFSVIDGTTLRYFHLGFPYLENNYIDVRNRIINTTLLNQAIPRLSTKTWLFTYFDPAGTCTSLVEIFNASQGCYGNQWSVTGTTTVTLDPASVTKLAFRFNNTIGDISPTGVSIRISSAVGAGNLCYGVQYNTPSGLDTGRPNGTWVTNSSANFVAGVTSANLIDVVFPNMTKNQYYHVVLDGSCLDAGTTKTAIYPRPQIDKVPKDYTSNNIEVNTYSVAGAKWTTVTAGGNLFSLRFNYTNNGVMGLQDDFGWSWTFDAEGGGTIGGTAGEAVIGEYFTIPFPMNVTGIGISCHDDTVPLPDNLSIHFYYNDTYENITGIKLNVSLSSATFNIFEVNLTTPVIIQKDRTIVEKLLCPLCNGLDGEAVCARTNEQAGHILSNNGTWQGIIGSYITSSNNGTTWIVGAVNLRRDLFFYLKGFKMLPPNWSSPMIDLPTVVSGDIVNFSTIWSDDKSLKFGTYIFELNYTSAGYKNATAIAFSVGTLQVSYNVTQIIAPVGTNVTWRFYANDSDNLFNNTPLQSFIINSTAGVVGGAVINEGKSDFLGIFNRGDFIRFAYQYLNVNNSVEQSTTNPYFFVMYPNTTIVQARGMQPFLPQAGIYQGNFSVSNTAPFGLYTIRINGTVDGANQTASLLYFKVQEPNTNGFYLIALLVGSALFIIGIVTRDRFISIISGFIVVIIGVYNSSVGFFRFQNILIDTGFLIVILGIGFYLIVWNGYQLLQESSS